MKPLKIQGRKDLPEVLLDAGGRLFMGGSSLPENPLEFFQPIMLWIDSYAGDSSQTTKVEFRFDYLNTASTHMMARIIDSLETLQNTVADLSVTWYYPHGDHDMRELGLELLEESKINYTILEIAS